MPRKNGNAEQVARSRPFKLETLRSVSPSSQSVEVGIKRTDIARTIIANVKTADIGRTTKELVAKFADRWQGEGAPKKAEYFWNDDVYSEKLGFYIPIAGGLSVAAYCGSVELVNDRVGAVVGNPFDPVRQEAVRYFGSSIIRTAGGLEAARLLELPPAPQPTHSARDYWY